MVFFRGFGVNQPFMKRCNSSAVSKYVHIWPNFIVSFPIFTRDHSTAVSKEYYRFLLFHSHLATEFHSLVSHIYKGPFVNRRNSRAVSKKDCTFLLFYSHWATEFRRFVSNFYKEYVRGHCDGCVVCFYAVVFVDRPDTIFIAITFFCWAPRS